MSKPEKYKAFLDELTALGRKHGFVLRQAWSYTDGIEIEDMKENEMGDEYECSEIGYELRLNDG